MVPRPHLLPCTARRVLVVAPAGFGKTSLLRQWAGDAPTLWLTFTPRPEGTPQLLGALRKVLGVEAPSVEGLVPLLTKQRLVLDDLSFLTETQDRADLDTLVEASDAFLLALGSRTEPNLPALHRRRVRQELTEVSAEPLGFRGDELRQWMEQALPAPLSPEILALLEAKTQGWAAVLVLVVQRLVALEPVQWPAAISSLSGHSQALYDYLATELLETLPLSLRQFLLESSVLPELVSTAENRALLRELERRRLLLTHAHGSFTLHALLREFLQARLEEERGTAGFRSFCDTQARLLWEQGQWEDAFRLWWQHGFLGTIVEAINQTHRERPLDYFPWVVRLPLALLEAHPWAFLLRASAETETHGEQAEALLSQAERLLADLPLGASEARLLCARLYRYQKKSAQVRPLLEALEPELTAPTPLRVRWLQEWAFYHYANADLVSAGRALNEAILLLQEVGGTPVQQASVLVQRATMIDVWQGRYDRVWDAHARVAALFAPKPPAVILAFLSVLEAEVALHCSDPESSTIFQRFLERATAAGYVVFQQQARLYLAYAAALRGERTLAQRLLEQTQATGGEYDFLFTLIPLLLQQDLALPLDLPVERPSSSLWTLFALPLVDRGERREALRLLAIAAEVAEELGNPLAQLRAAYFTALAQPDQAHLTQCLQGAEQHQLNDELLALPQIGHVLSVALAHGVAPMSVCRLLQRAGLSALVVRGFGGLLLQGNAGMISWTRPKARALFAYLWLAAGKPVLVERVVEALWSGADAEKGRQSYRTHATYLRRALGEGCLEATQERVRLLLPEPCFDDRQLLLRAHESEDPTLWRHALLVVGEEEFLPEFAYEDWAVLERERLHRVRQELRLRLAQHALAARRPSEALALARTVLAADPLDEDAALTALSALLALERLSEARQLWEQVREAHVRAGLPLTHNAQIVVRKLGLGR